MKVYIAGPMRGLVNWNFEAFDLARTRWREKGHLVFCPAQLVRALQYSEGTGEERDHCTHAIQVDFACIYASDAIALLPGWERSRGATAELALAQFLGLRIFDAVTMVEVFPPKCPWDSRPEEYKPVTMTPVVDFQPRVSMPPLQSKAPPGFYKCPYCGGKGRWEDGDEAQYVTCVACNGSGTLTILPPGVSTRPPVCGSGE